ncbi:ribonuclease H-like domain-containing protein [Tanacetum coccineum]
MYNEPNRSRFSLTGPHRDSGCLTRRSSRVYGFHGYIWTDHYITSCFYRQKTLQDLAYGAWNMDMGASSHLNNSVTSLNDVFNTCIYPSVSVGDGHSIPVINTGHSILPNPFRSLHLNIILITPDIVKILIYVRQFVRDNNCTIEFDAFGFSVKDFMTSIKPKSVSRYRFLGDSPDIFPQTINVILRQYVPPHSISINPILDTHTVATSLSDVAQTDQAQPPTSPMAQPHDTTNVHQAQYLADGIFSRYKARLVANGSTQLEGVDVDETFRSLYRRKQAPRAWHGLDTDYLLLYVDDIVLTTSSQPLLQLIIASLHQEFSMTDLGSLNYFLGISITRDSSGMFLSQKKYVVEILERANIDKCNLTRTPIDIESNLGNDGNPVSDLTLYQSFAGSLQYLTFTLPDISYAVHKVCLHRHDPREPHFSSLKRILRYVRGTLDYRL